jgi:hypothetical protein
MEEVTLIFVVILGGVLLGLACNAMSAGGEEQADTSSSETSASEPNSTEAPAVVSPNPDAKDCKSCGGPAQTGRLCSFCGRAL